MKYSRDLKIIRNKRLSADYFQLILHDAEELPEIKPGQFVEVLVENSKNTFLRRPFSIHDIDSVNSTITLLVRIAGDGTRNLAYMDEGDYLNIIYPLGNGFTIQKNKKVTLIGGGCGIAPLLFLARELHQNNNDIHIFLGAKSNEELSGMDIFDSLGNVKIATDDGSAGHTGFITQHPDFLNLENIDFIYTCGPVMMMQEIARIAKNKQVECEVSLENTMACGVGACLCCVTDTIEGNQCVCTEGPVFNINKLKWQI